MLVSRSKPRSLSGLHAGKALETEGPFGSACWEGASKEWGFENYELADAPERVGLGERRAGKERARGGAFGGACWEGGERGCPVERGGVGKAIQRGDPFDRACWDGNSICVLNEIRLTASRLRRPLLSSAHAGMRREGVGLVV